MHTLLGILSLVGAVAFPMGLLVWLALRMNRKPALSSNRLGLILAFNGVLPVGLVLFGLGLLAPEFGALRWVRIGAAAALVGSLLLLLAWALDVRKRSI